MSKIKVSVEHDLDRDDAKQRVENLISILKEEYGSGVENIREEWKDYTGSFAFNAMGFSVDGNLFIEPNNVTLEGSLPLAALPFKSRIENTIRDRLQILLS